MTARRDVLAAALLLLGLGLGGGCSGSSPTSPATPSPTPPVALVLTSANFADVCLSERNVCLVEFHAQGCPACQSMSATVSRLATDYAGRAVVGQVDVGTERELKEQWRVTAWPTFVFVRNGREFSRLVGTTSYDTLAAMLNAALAA